MSTNKSIQRLVVKYKEALDQIAKREADLSQVRAGGSGKGTVNGQTPVFGRRDDALNSAFNRDQRIRDPRQVSPTKRIAPVTASTDDNNNNNIITENKDKEDAVNDSVTESAPSTKQDEAVAAEEKMEDN